MTAATPPSPIVPADPPAPDGAAPDLATACRYWLKLGLLSFGGVAGQLGMMQHDLVDRLRWIDQKRYLTALNFCMLLPGPEVQQLTIWIGWRLNGLWGGILAGTLFILPGAAIMLALAWLVAAQGDVGWVAALFSGVQPVVIAIVLTAIWRMGRKSLTGPLPVAIAVTAFAALALLSAPFPLVIVAAALFGLLAGRLGWIGGGRAARTADPAVEAPGSRQPVLPRLARMIAIFVALWAIPVVLALWLLGPDPFADVTRLFTTAAFVTFGGAYAVLPFIADAGVETYGWLTAAEMVRGLALAESTPGPTILVVQFVGFFAGWSEAAAAGLSPALAGTLAAGLTLWVTFLPCYLFVLAGAPYVERITQSAALSAGLVAIGAAVIGVIADLAVFIGAAVLLPAGSIDPFALLLTGVALIALLRFKIAPHWVVAAGAVVGLATLALPV